MNFRWGVNYLQMRQCQCSFKNENSVISPWRWGDVADIKIVTMKSPGWVFRQLSQERTAALSSGCTCSVGEQRVQWKLSLISQKRLPIRIYMWDGTLLTSACIDLLWIHLQNELQLIDKTSSTLVFFFFFKQRINCVPTSQTHLVAGHFLFVSVVLTGQRSGKRLGSSLYSAGMKKIDSSNSS